MENRTNQDKLITTILILATIGLVITIIGVGFRLTKAAGTKKTLITATTTYVFPPSVIRLGDTGDEHKSGACVKILDYDASGYTYLTTQGGVATFSAASCE